MLSYILQKAQQFERDFGVAPNVIYINPGHYAAMARQHPELFAQDQVPRLGFRMVILPATQLSHPEAALLMHGSADTVRASTAAEDDPLRERRDVA